MEVMRKERKILIFNVITISNLPFPDQSVQKRNISMGIRGARSRYFR